MLGKDWLGCAFLLSGSLTKKELRLRKSPAGPPPSINTYWELESGQTNLLILHSDYNILLYCFIYSAFY